MTTAELIAHEATDLRRASLAEIMHIAEEAAAKGAELRPVLNVEERVAFDAFQALAIAARHVLSLCD